MKKVTGFVKIGLSAIILLCGALCVFWLPKAVDYLDGFLKSGQAALWGGFAVFALPIFIILLLGFSFLRDIEKDSVFSVATSRRMKLVAILLGVDCLLFCAFVAVIVIMGEGLLAPIFGFIGFMGLLVDCALFVLSDYIKRAAVLKEESEATL